MSSPYESSFRKVASVEEVPAGTPRVFRAAGATVVIRRDGQTWTAIDGSCLTDAAETSSEDRLRKILTCVAAGTGSTTAEWEQLHARAGLPVRVDDGAIWVCVEGCR
ncbi:MAG TPA: hypothetical protein VFT12_03065 [Thermoanaerobaculia bacterium]|nr:hypothetical protein [Thermoanaerobaculia bacterium]